jgi:two-component system, sensor histidine kinase and response regulator
MEKQQSEQPLILIVDDISENLKVIGSILMTKKYNILPATSGRMAIELASGELPDLILLDIQMPEMDGFEVCRKLKEDAKTKNIPIIFLTAKTETENIVNGFEIGGDDYITKPFEPKEMLARVNTHLLLRSSMKKLIELNATKDKFFSIITHDLKGPFTAIVRVANNLNNLIKEKKDKEISDTSQILTDAAKEAFALLENLLKWSRSQTGRIECKPENISLLDLSKKSMSTLKSIALNKNISLINKIPEKVHVFADENLLNTILRNLISNAIKYTKSEGSVKIWSSEKDKEVEIIVEDTGVGISMDVLERLFTIEMKCFSLGTDNEKGTGLGLILCQEFTKMMGGRIHANSRIGEGSQFVITLPKAVN